MQKPEFAAIGGDEPFQFACGPGVSCFNQCCRDLNQALMPYDVYRLRCHLGLSWADFLKRFAVLYPGSATGLPVVSLKFSAARDRSCPFVTSEGCSVYQARPTSCRLYPVARALQRSRSNGRFSEHFALIREAHCRGFEQGASQTVHQWIEAQGAREGLAAGDLMMDLIALKNRLRPGRLDPEQEEWVTLAFYDPESLRQKAGAGLLPHITQALRSALPADGEVRPWLAWGAAWLRQALFGTIS